MPLERTTLHYGEAPGRVQTREGHAAQTLPAALETWLQVQAGTEANGNADPSERGKAYTPESGAVGLSPPEHKHFRAYLCMPCDKDSGKAV